MKKEILVVFGGVSPEHEVSVITAMQAIAALDSQKFNVSPLYITKSGRWLTGDSLSNLESYKDLKKLESNAEVCYFTTNSFGQVVLKTTKTGLFGKSKEVVISAAILALHGSEGENGAVQGLFETLNVPYTGSNVLASSVGMDKAVAKSLCRAAHLPVVDDVVIYENEWIGNETKILKEITSSLNLPVFVKPSSLGSSIGVNKVSDWDSLEQTIESVFRYDHKIIVENGVSPLVEINCSVMGNHEKIEASLCEQPKGKADFLSFEDKYMGSSSGKGMASTDRIIPAPISEDHTKQIQSLAKSVFRTLQSSGLARLDFLLNQNTNEVFFNEINTIPGSFSFYLWDKSGYDFPSLLERLVEIAEQNHRLKNGRTRSYETNLLSTKATTGLKSLKGK